MLRTQEVEEGGVGVETGYNDFAVEGPALHKFNAGDMAVVHVDPGDIGRLQDGAASLDDLACQGTCQLVGTAVEVALVHSAVEKERDVETYPCFPGIQPPHAADVQQKSPYPVILEIFIDDLQRALLYKLEHLVADVGALHSDTDVYGRHSRYIGRWSQYLAHYAAPGSHKLAKGHGVFM